MQKTLGGNRVRDVERLDMEKVWDDVIVIADEVNITEVSNGAIVVTKQGNIDKITNGGLVIYTEELTYSVTPSGNCLHGIRSNMEVFCRAISDHQQLDTALDYLVSRFDL